MSNPRIERGDITTHNVNLLKLINQKVFPVNYNVRFYKDSTTLGKFCQLAYLDDLAIGAICARVENHEGIKRCYIMTIGCLDKYRRLGVGTTLLNYILETAKADGCVKATLHVQTSNQLAIEFYEKNGFAISDTISGYYKNIEPADAHVLEKRID